MADNCLFEINATGTYTDCWWLAAISIGLILGQVIILTPLIKPTAKKYYDLLVKSTSEPLQDMVTEEEATEQPEQTDQTDDVEMASSISLTELDLEMSKYWKEYQQTFNVFGFNFNGYVILVSIACVFVLLGTIFLIYSVDDPREIWKNEGWKRSINLSTMFIAIVSEADGLMLLMTMPTVEAVLVYYEETNATRLFKLIYFVSPITKLVFLCIYYPYIVAALLNAVFMGVVGAICISCCRCCFWIIIYGLFYGLLYPLRMFMKEEKWELVRDITVFCVFGAVLVYVSTVLATIIVFAVTGGIDNPDFCIHDNVKSWMAVVWMEIGPAVLLISFVLKFCTNVKNVQGGSMTLKTTENEEESQERTPLMSADK